MPARYAALRAARATDMMCRARRAGRLYQAPPHLARAIARLGGLVPSAAAARPLAPVVEWHPPGPVR